MAQDELQHVQALIAEGRLDEARALLQTMDRPEVPQLLAMLDQMQQTAQQVAASVAPEPALVEAVPAADASGSLLDRLSQEAQAPAAVPTPPRPRPRPAVRLEGNRRVHDEGTYEMLWDCQFCGATKLLAKTHRYCPNCGAAQDPDARYFPAEGEYVAVEDHIYVGADRICPNCKALNSTAAEFCGTCGTPLTNAARARVRDSETRRAGQSFIAGDAPDLKKQRFDSEMERVGVKPKARAGGKRLPTWAIILIGLVVLGCIGALVAAFWTRGADAVLTGHSWERTISIEQYGPQPGNAWCDSLPRGAYSISRQREVRSYNQIPDGESCETRRVDQGDGTFRQERVCHTTYRQEPVYADKCHFTIDTWRNERTASAGDDSAKDPPYWPPVSLACENQNCIGCERESGRDEVYRLHLRSSEGQDFTCDVTQNAWSAASLELHWQIQMGVIGGSPHCDTLQPAG